MSLASSAAADTDHDKRTQPSNNNDAAAAERIRNDGEEVDGKTTAKPVIETSVEDGGKAAKENGHQQHLHPTNHYGASIARIPSPDTLSEISVGENGLLRPGRGSIALQPLSRIASRSPGPQPRGGFAVWLHEFWIKNKGLAYVLLAQIFGVLMNVTTR